VDSRRAADLSDVTPLRLLGHPLRRRLYQLVAQADRAIGRDEAADAIGVSRSLAAYHLDKLSAQGLLETSFARLGDRSGPGAGRPAKLYRRAESEFAFRTPPRDYQLLAELFVRAAADDQTGAFRGTLDRVAFGHGRDTGRDARLTEAADRTGLEAVLRRRGYEPFEDAQGTLRLKNCPFDRVAGECREVVCRLNLRLIEGMLDGLRLRRTHAALEPSQRFCCVAIPAPR
jgi:predicted ArsR family transcriptional regulator